MAVTCGFFNSLNHDRKYNSEQISRIFDGIIRDGVYMSIGDKLAVTATSGFTVNVGSGRAWFDHTWTYNDTDLPIELDAPDLVLDRYDAIILEVNSSEEVRNNEIKPLYGTAASDPQKPAMSKTDFIHQVPLAFIKRKPGSTEIKAEDIEIVVGKDECPYVTSILEAASVEELFVQWDAQFGSWQDGQKAEFEAWFEGIKGELSSDQAGNLQLQINEKGVQLYTHSKSGTVHEFTGQGPNGRAKMTADVASGDTFTVNGTPVTAYMGVDEAVGSMAGSVYNGRWVTFVYDSEENTLNFKGGGGQVTVSGLSADVVKKGTTVTVKQGAKTIQNVDGGYTPTFRTQQVSQSAYVQKHTWHTFQIPVPPGTVGVITCEDNLWGCRVTGLSDNILSVAFWGVSESGTRTITATVLICEDLEQAAQEESRSW